MNKVIVSVNKGLSVMLLALGLVGLFAYVTGLLSDTNTLVAVLGAVGFGLYLQEKSK